MRVRPGAELTPVPSILLISHMKSSAFLKLFLTLIRIQRSRAPLKDSYHRHRLSTQSLSKIPF